MICVMLFKANLKSMSAIQAIQPAKVRQKTTRHQIACSVIFDPSRRKNIKNENFTAHKHELKRKFQAKTWGKKVEYAAD